LKPSGIPATVRIICQTYLSRLADASPIVGVHGKPVELHMEKLWDRNISLTTRLVEDSHNSDAAEGRWRRRQIAAKGNSVTHRFAMNDIMKAYDTVCERGRKRELSRWFSRMTAPSVISSTHFPGIALLFNEIERERAVEAATSCRSSETKRRRTPCHQSPHNRVAELHNLGRPMPTPPQPPRMVRRSFNRS